MDPKEATDDRLGILLSELGGDQEKLANYQVEAGRYLIRAYELPTASARYDTTSVNVYHAPAAAKEGGLLAWGWSKDHRPDRLPFKPGLGTLDPAGVPLMTETLPGNQADDGGYVPAWRRMAETVGHRDFFLIGDSKGGGAGDAWPTGASERALPVSPSDDGQSTRATGGLGSGTGVTKPSDLSRRGDRKPACW